MKFQVTYILLLILTLLIFSCPIHAQKTTAKPKVDSTKILSRKAVKSTASLSNIQSLAWYNFSSELVATFSFIDSLNKITSKTTYQYYFDIRSNFMAMKEIYEFKNKMRSSFRIEELKDSIGFKTTLDDSLHNFATMRLKHPLKGNNIRQNTPTSFKKTGLTKEINGYICESLKFENYEVSHTIWVTQQPDPFLIKIRKDLQYAAYNELTAYLDGIVMLSECYYKQSNHTQKFEVVSVQKNSQHRTVTNGKQLLRGF